MSEWRTEREPVGAGLGQVNEVEMYSMPPSGADRGWAPRATGLYRSAQFPCCSPFPKYWVGSWMRDVTLGLEREIGSWRLQRGKDHSI